MLHLPHASQVASLERLKFLYPTDFRALETTSVAELRKQLDSDLRSQKWLVSNQEHEHSVELMSPPANS